ncbi:MAG: hypothetical protein IPO50_11450 [Sphingomonadales bacterium]|nr:hypothetical protein [Sphingomonadales bacterium]
MSHFFITPGMIRRATTARPEHFLESRVSPEGCLSEILPESRGNYQGLAFVGTTTEINALWPRRYIFGFVSINLRIEAVRSSQCLFDSQNHQVPLGPLMVMLTHYWSRHLSPLRFHRFEFDG